MASARIERAELPVQRNRTLYLGRFISRATGKSDTTRRTIAIFHRLFALPSFPNISGLKSGALSGRLNFPCNCGLRRIGIFLEIHRATLVASAPAGGANRKAPAGGFGGADKGTDEFAVNLSDLFLIEPGGG